MIDGQGERDAERDPFVETGEDDPIKAVEDGEPYTPPDVARSPTGASGDQALAAEVRRELSADAATTHLDLTIDVKDGIATLRGPVDDLEDSDRALEAAGRVPGIVDVIDEMEVSETA